MKNTANAEAIRMGRLAAKWGELAIRKGINVTYGEAVGDPFQAYWRARLAFRAAYRLVGR